MSNTEIGFRFSGKNMYATKRQVSRELGIHSIDGIWDTVVQYRSNFATNLELVSTDQTAYVLCQTPYITNLVGQFDSKLNSVFLKFVQLGDKTHQERLTNISLNKCLLTFAKKFGQIHSDPYHFSRIISGSFSAVAPQNLIFVNYLKALRVIQNSISDPIDIDYVARIFSAVSGNYELVRLYRDSELVDMNRRVLVNPDFRPASPSTIDRHMNQLFDFISSSTLSTSIRAIVSCFYITEIVPFDDFSEEVGVLMLKAVLANNLIGEVASLLNFESLLTTNEALLNTIKEVNHTKDITYFVDFALRFLIEALDDILSDITLSKAENLAKESYSLDEDIPLDSEVSNENDEIIDVVSNETQRPGDISFSDNSNVDTKVEIAIPSFSVGFNEQDARLLERHLIESDPRLKSSEARFYARHCTMGKFYSIRQFQHTMDTAYETARKSMDSLVVLGYYRKEAVKNKFVYTPIKKKGND